MSWYQKKIVDRRQQGFKRFKARHSFDGLGVIAEFADLSFETWNGIVPREDLHLIQNDIGIDIDRLELIIADAKEAGLMFEDERGIFVDSVPESKASLDQSRSKAKNRMHLLREKRKEAEALEDCSGEHSENVQENVLSNISNNSLINNKTVSENSDVKVEAEGYITFDHVRFEKTYFDHLVKKKGQVWAERCAIELNAWVGKAQAEGLTGEAERRSRRCKYPLNEIETWVGKKVTEDLNGLKVSELRVKNAGTSRFQKDVVKPRPNLNTFKDYSKEPPEAA